LPLWTASCNADVSLQDMPSRALLADVTRYFPSRDEPKLLWPTQDSLATRPNGWNVDLRFQCKPLSQSKELQEGRVDAYTPSHFVISGKLSDSPSYLDAGCKRCVPSWEISYIPIGQPPWSAVSADKGGRFQCPSLPRPCRLAYPWPYVAA